jgi:ribosomal protein S18 acetylase RimI-like enzyme
MQIRAATLGDVDRLASFMGRCTLAHQGVHRASADEMRQRLTHPGTDPALDTWLAEDRGEIVAFAQAWEEEEAVVCYVRVDPQQRGRGLGSTLLERAAARAQEVRPKPALHATSWPRDAAAAPLLEGAGFSPLRYLSLMTIDFAGPPEPPGWAVDVVVRALDEHLDLRRIHDAQQTVFPAQSFEDWLHEYAHIDPTLWFVAEDADGIAGFALCLPELSEDPEAGYVSELGVRPDRRGQGLGLALLRHTFVEFHARGKRRVTLHVDVDNLTGALRLYTRAGMRPDPRLVVWERPLG